MTCTVLNEDLDNYLAGDCDADRARLLDAHVRACSTCSELVTTQRVLLQKLAAYGRATVPQPDDGFYANAIANAAQATAGKQRKRQVMTGIGAAMAAAIIMWMAGGMLLSAPDMNNAATDNGAMSDNGLSRRGLDSGAQASVPGVTMALEEARTVNLVFSSAQVLANATMTVTLPPGIEVSGFHGQREISWMTSLKQGKNVLPLTLIATSPQGGELLATLQHENNDRSFRVQVTVIQEPNGAST